MASPPGLVGGSGEAVSLLPASPTLLPGPSNRVFKLPPLLDANGAAVAGSSNPPSAFEQLSSLDVGTPAPAEDETDDNLGWVQVGPLARTAHESRMLYQSPASRELFMTACGNMAFAVCLGISTDQQLQLLRRLLLPAVGLAWWYGCWRLWRNREQQGLRFKAFVVQEGFVYSRMLEVFTCTWICIACILLFTALMWGTLLWQLPLLSASLSAYVPLRCESMLWLFPLIVNLPIMLSLDTVSSTSIFKEAAVKKGYPGVAFFHVNFNARFVLLVLNAAGFWLVDLVTEALGQHGAQWRVYRLYALIAQAGVYTLFLFMLLPRWTNMCKSREAMLKLKEEGGFNPRVARISETSDFTGSPGIDSATNCSPQPSSLAPGRRRAPFRGKALTFTSAQDVKHMIQAATTKVQAPPARGASIAWTEASCVASETPRNPKARAVMAATLGAEPTYRNAQAAFGGRADEGEIGLEKIEGTQFLSNLSRGVMSSFIRTQSAIAHKVRAAVRVSSNPLRAVLGGLWHMPMGARVLVENVAAALSHLRVKWRWWAASQSDKFLFITGMLVPGALQWPAVALRSTGWALPAVMNGVALIFVLILNWAMIFGRLSRADQTMMLKEAAENGTIGSGLVFSTSSILRAMRRCVPVDLGYVATEDRLISTAALSCRWDKAGRPWSLEVRERDGSTRTCSVMMPRMQLLRAALAARASRCHYMWLDTLSVPQPERSDSPEVAAVKEICTRRLIPTMTAVYASVRLVLVVETATGCRPDADGYARRTWTLQECVLNPCTGWVRLDGAYSRLGGANERRQLSGLEDDSLSKGADDLASYSWVLEGGERAAARSTTPERRQAFPAFANTRAAARAGDKAVALGQIFFLVIFEHVDVASTFMMEVAALLTNDPYAGAPVTLIDNREWDDVVNSGSGCITRYLMGAPSFLESGPGSLWKMWRAELRRGQAATLPCVDSETGEADCSGEQWWLCEILLSGRRVKVAILPGRVFGGNNGQQIGHLKIMRTCTPAEKEIMYAARMQKMEVLWL
eukprot:jgi/Tetstr1/441273/TSEL_029524.t1